MAEDSVSGAPRWTWPALAALAALAAVHGVFTTSEIFYVRDLSGYFWPNHLWLRRMLLDGRSPFWDPNPGFGYATAGDAALHLFFLPTLPLRLLPPVLGFNLVVALPFPLAALGMFAFLRRRHSAPASSLAAALYAVSGTFITTANCNNLAWC